MLNTGSLYKNGSASFIYGDQLGGENTTLALPEIEFELPPLYNAVDWSLTDTTNTTLAIQNKPTMPDLSNVVRQSDVTMGINVIYTDFAGSSGTKSVAGPTDVSVNRLNRTLFQPESVSSPFRYTGVVAIQAWFYSPIATQLPAGFVSFFAAKVTMTGVSYVDPAIGFVPGNLFFGPDGNNAAPYPGFVGATAPTLARQVTSNGGPEGSATYVSSDLSMTPSGTVVSKEYTVPAGFTEFRFAFRATIDTDTCNIQWAVPNWYTSIPKVVIGDLSASNLKKVAFTADYNDLTNKLALATVATTGSYTDLINKPSASISTSPVYWAHYSTTASRATEQGFPGLFPKSRWSPSTNPLFRSGNNTTMPSLSEGNFSTIGNFVFPVTGIWQLSWTLGFLNYNQTEVNAVWLAGATGGPDDTPDYQGRPNQRLGYQEVAGGRFLTAVHTDYFVKDQQVSPVYLSLIFPNTVGGNAATDNLAGALKVTLINYA